MKKYDIITISGGFDPIHAGHIKLFKASKSLGHKVICGLNSDKWLVNRKGFVFMNWKDRAEILEAFSYIDEVISFNDDDSTSMDFLVRMQRLYPTCSIAFANGGKTNIENLPEKGFCDAYGIDMLFNVGGDKIKSSIDIIEKIQNLKQ